MVADPPPTTVPSWQDTVRPNNSQLPWVADTPGRRGVSPSGNGSVAIDAWASEGPALLTVTV
jgi:hypothetical protein